MTQDGNLIEYYIISVKRTQRRHAYITLWRPKNAGYTASLENAGRYSEETVRAELYYYNAGLGRIAVPCSIVNCLAEKATPGTVDGDGLILPNTRKNWKVLISNTIEPPPYPVEPEYKGAPRRERAGAAC